jgi:dTDP-glucose pyrophosphorylase
MMWGIVPAAGIGSRIQPLAFSKELLPVGSRVDGDTERPRAVSEYLLERMIIGGAGRICVVISPGKSDIIEYYGGSVAGADVCYVVQPRPQGLCDAIFCALPILGESDEVVVGLPDTVWFPEDALRRLPAGELSFLCFPVDRPDLFDAVLSEDDGRVKEMRVKQNNAGTRWVWGAFKMPVSILRQLHALWLQPDRRDPYIGTLVNAWLARGGRARAVRAGEAYVDVGTLHGYRQAIHLLESPRGDARPQSEPVTSVPLYRRALR